MAKLTHNPKNPWQATHVEWLEQAPPADLRVYEEEARSILSANKSPDLGFSWSVNPYRGCFHACSYCYARPSHQYLDLGAGTDFERKLFVKTNAPKLLTEAFERPSWKGEQITFSGNTDCYQPLELERRLTRELLTICAAFRNPVGIITKSAMIERDIDVLQDLQRDASVHVYISIPFLDRTMARRIEPGAPSPSARLAAMRALSEAGIPVGLALAPIIPGLNDDQVLPILEAAAENGARFAFRSLVRLEDEVEEVFLASLQDTYPDRFDKVQNAIREMRGGKLSEKRFGHRFRGEGARWEMIAQLFDQGAKRLGIQAMHEREIHERARNVEHTFRRPGNQLELFS